MRPHMVPNAHLLKLLFLARYTSRSVHLVLCMYEPISIVLRIIVLDAPFYNILHTTFTTHILPFLSIKFKNPYTVDEYSQKLNERKILTVLRRNSIIIVNCSTEYI